jgi:4-hydroxy-tetrahydrodipicolinate reductase
MKEKASQNNLSNISGLVIGSTGHSDECKKAIEGVANSIAVCLVSNFSKGIFLFEEMLKATTSNGMPVYKLAQSLGFDLGLHEVHHTQKKDAPSGTALTLAQASQIEDPLKISSLRVGKVIGEHTWFASSDFEQLSLTHIAYNRKLFAQGAVDICKNIFYKRPAAGFLDKKDFLI